MKQLRVLAEASHSYGTFNQEKAQGPEDFGRIRDLALDALGSPSADEIVSCALELLGREDRNLRVAALRVLAWYLDRDDVVEALLHASRDSARRVRTIALSLAPAEHPKVRERLIEVAED
ncbi:MAG TPA: HEAT repeat domain-containing protein, partial [Acidimicrobiales bacterium]|nr:HEAT repeat domain-containing protein [Acidimicrobiales bacterium]